MDYTQIRWLVFIIPVTLFTIVLFFIHTGVGVVCFFTLIFTAQLTSLTAFHQRASPWRETLDGILNEIFTIFFKIGLKKKATRTQELCQKEAKKIFQLIIKDFVNYWYREISDDTEFPSDILMLLEHLAIKMEDRSRAINIEEVLADVLPLVTAQLKAVSESAVQYSNGVKKFDVQGFECVRDFEGKHHDAVHCSLVSYNTEYRHIKNIIDLFFDTLLPIKYKHCEAGRLFVREVLTCRVVLPMINRICDPDFLYQAIVHLLSPANPKRIELIMRQIKAENTELGKNNHLSHHNCYASYMGRTVHGYHSNSQSQSSNLTLSFEASHDQSDDLKQSPVSVMSVRYVQHGGYFGYIIQFPLEAIDESDNTSVEDSPKQMVHALVRYSRFEKLHATLNKPPLSRFLEGMRLPEKKSVSFLLHKVTSWFDERDVPLLEERKTGLEMYLRNLWKASEIRSSGVFRHFLMEGVEAYKNYCIDEEEIGEEALNFNYEAVTGDMAATAGPMSSQLQPSSVKPRRAPLQKMLNNYLYIHLPLNTTTLPALSLNIETSCAAQTDNKPSTLRSRSSSASDSSVLFTSVTASSDRRHFYTDHQSLEAVDEAPKKSNISDSHLSDSSTISPLATTASTATTPVLDAAPSATLTSPTAASTPTATLTSPTATTPTSHTPVPTLLLAESPATSIQKQPSRGIKSYLTRTFWQVCQLLLTLFKASFVPVSSRMVTLLAKEQEKRAPLSNALFCFVTEITSKTTKEPWLCNERLQLGMLSLFGKQLDRYILDLLLSVTEDEVQWCRAMYHLRNLFWPGGQFDTSQRERLSEQESIQLKCQAQKVIKEFFPSFFSSLLGQEDYDQSIQLFLACLENPRLNRHIFYKVLDVVIARMIPEITQSQFTDQLLLHRTCVL